MATHELLSMGIGKAGIAKGMASGEIVRIRQGWYANPWLPFPAQQAARIGGQLACLSAAAHWDLWHFGDDRLHVAVDGNDCQLRTRTSYRTRLSLPHSADVEVHWTGTDQTVSRVVVSPVVCVRQVAACCEPESALVVVESALNRGLVSGSEWTNLLAILPQAAQATLAHATHRSDSGTETLFVHRMRRAGIGVIQQFPVPGVGHVDCLIGERLVIELDSEAHHSDPTEDRRRDALLSARGYRVLRFMYSQVVHRWPEVERAVLAAISRGDHLPA
jgi:very-short-patch-repair endonuclease